MRVDKFLKVARIIKRRTLANEVCDGGRVSINGRRAKAGAEVKAGDVIRIDFGRRVLTVEVLEVRQTVRASEAKDLYAVKEEIFKTESDLPHLEDDPE